jgi:hypothetical protein
MSHATRLGKNHSHLPGIVKWLKAVSLLFSFPLSVQYIKTAALSNIHPHPTSAKYSFYLSSTHAEYNHRKKTTNIRRG